MTTGGTSVVESISSVIQHWCEDVDLQELLVKLQHILTLARIEEQQRDEMREKSIQLENENDDLIRSIERLTACVDDESDESEKAYNTSNYSGSSGSNSHKLLSNINSNSNNNSCNNSCNNSNSSGENNNDIDDATPNDKNTSSTSNNQNNNVNISNNNNISDNNNNNYNSRNKNSSSNNSNNNNYNNMNNINFYNNHNSKIMRKSLLLDKHFHADSKTTKYLSLQELRQHADFNENPQEEDYKTRRRRKVKTEIWDTPEYGGGMGAPMARGHHGRTSRRSLTKIDYTSSIEIIREEMKKEKARRRIIVDDSVNSIEKIKAKLELERMKNRRIIERKIKRISELERRVDQHLNEARELRNENREVSNNLCECQEELNKVRVQQDFNADDLSKYKEFFMNRFVLYNFISKDLNNLESLLPSQRLCFPRYKRERNIIGRIKKLLGDGMSVNYTVRPAVAREATER